MISNIPVTGVPSVVSGILTRGDATGVGVGVVATTLAATLALTLGLGLGLAALLGEGDGEASLLGEGDGDRDGDELAAVDAMALGDGEVAVPATGT